MRDFNRSRSDSIELQLDNKQIVSFVIGSLVVLGVVFALGVMVGKQLAAKGGDGQLAPANPLAAIDARQKALADATDASEPEPEPEAQQEAKAAKDAKDAKDGKGDQALTFAQELTKPKADPLIEPTRPATAEPKPQPKHEEPAADPAAKGDPSGSTKSHTGLAAAFEKATGEKPTAEKPKSEKATSEKATASKPASASEGAFALQVASLPSRSDAEKVVQKLSSKGYKGYIVAADIPGKGQYFRVKVGSYATREEANKAASSLKQKTSMTAMVTSAH
jgi:cell division septation protein DedD